MTPISFFAQGVPKGQPRMRAFARKFGDKFQARVYDPGTAEGWKSCVAEAAKPFLRSERITDPVFVSCVFVLPRPKKHFFTGARSNVLRPDAPLYDTRKPDLDNYEKAVWDALVIIGMLADDALIVQNTSSKLFAFGPKTGALITIQPADDLFAIGTGERISASFKSEDHARASVIPGVPSPGAEKSIPVAQQAVIQAVTGP